MNEEERKKKIFEEIIAEAQRASCKKREDEFSATEFATMAGISHNAATKLLRERVNNGQLAMRPTKKGEFYSVV